MDERRKRFFVLARELQLTSSACGAVLQGPNTGAELKRGAMKAHVKATAALSRERDDLALFLKQSSGR